MNYELLLKKTKNKTVLNASEIALLLGEALDHDLYSSLSYYAKVGKILRLSKGIYALNDNYSIYEYANKLRSPSYVSLESVLYVKGIVYQQYEKNVYLVSYRSETIEFEDHTILYRKIKDSILFNGTGIQQNANVSIATVERALLDKVYLDGAVYFDDLSEINWDLAKELNDIVYRSSKIERFIKENA